MESTLLFDAAKAGVLSIERNMTKPNDDWVATLISIDQEGSFHFTTLAGVQDHETLRTTLTETLRSNGAVEAAFVCSSWMVTRDSYEEAALARPSEEPDRVEAVFITWVTRDSAMSTYALIKRRASAPPVLGKFGVPSEGLQVDGPFADALRLGIVA